MSPPTRPRIRSAPEDFVVDELPLYPPCGEGEHTFVHVEKRLRSTEEVARELARIAGASPRDVGYAGRKDRVAVARQWFSVPGLDPARVRDADLRAARVLAATPHRHKLRTGQLRGNRFELVVREVSARAAELARARARTLGRVGMPNRYGTQRYGRHGDNAERGAALLRGEGARTRDRREERFLVSSLQSLLFDRVLAERPLPLDVVEAGDVAVVHLSGGLFDVEDGERECPRARAFEISATGPIFGTRMRRPAGAPARREADAARELGLPAFDALRAPRGIRMRGARRALRVRPVGLALEASDADATLRLRFELPAGSYATVLIEELFGEVAEGPAAAVS